MQKEIKNVENSKYVGKYKKTLVKKTVTTCYVVIKKYMILRGMGPKPQDSKPSIV